MGVVFQITDDLLDVTSTAEKTGKAVGKDADMGKATLVTLLGVEGARAEAEKRARARRRSAGALCRPGARTFAACRSSCWTGKPERDSLPGCIYGGAIILPRWRSIIAGSGVLTNQAYLKRHFMTDRIVPALSLAFLVLAASRCPPRRQAADPAAATDPEFL